MSSNLSCKSNEKGRNFTKRRRSNDQVPKEDVTQLTQQGLSSPSYFSGSPNSLKNSSSNTHADPTHVTHEKAYESTTTGSEPVSSAKSRDDGSGHESRNLNETLSASTLLKKQKITKQNANEIHMDMGMYRRNWWENQIRSKRPRNALCRGPPRPWDRSTRPMPVAGVVDYWMPHTEIMAAHYPVDKLGASPYDTGAPPLNGVWGQYPLPTSEISHQFPPSHPSSPWLNNNAYFSNTWRPNTFQYDPMPAPSETASTPTVEEETSTDALQKKQEFTPSKNDTTSSFPLNVSKPVSTETPTPMRRHPHDPRFAMAPRLYSPYPEYVGWPGQWNRFPVIGGRRPLSRRCSIPYVWNSPFLRSPNVPGIQRPVHMYYSPPNMLARPWMGPHAMRGPFVGMAPSRFGMYVDERHPSTIPAMHEKTFEDSIVEELYSNLGRWVQEGNKESVNTSLIHPDCLTKILDQVRDAKNLKHVKVHGETVQETLSTLNDNECQEKVSDEKDGCKEVDNPINDKTTTVLSIKESLPRTNVDVLAMKLFLPQESTKSLSPRSLTFENCSTFSHFKIHWDLSKKVDTSLEAMVNENGSNEECRETTELSPTVLSQTQSGMVETMAEDIVDSTFENAVSSLTVKEKIEETTLPSTLNDGIQNTTERLTFDNLTTLNKRQLDAFITTYKSFLACSKLSCFPWDYAFSVSFSNNETADDLFCLPRPFVDDKKKKHKFNIVNTYIPLQKTSESILPNIYPLFHCVLDCSEDPCAITQFTKVSISGRRVINVLLELELVKTVLKSFKINDQQT